MNVAELFTAMTLGALLAGIASLDLESAEEDVRAVDVAMSSLAIQPELPDPGPIACR